MNIRKANEADTPMLEQWLAKDEAHQAIGLKIEDFTAPNTELYIVEDGIGPVMAVRIHMALRAGIQFNPDTPYRNAKASTWVKGCLEDTAKNRKAKEVIVRPGGKAQRMCERLGFKHFIGLFLEPQ